MYPFLAPLFEHKKSVSIVDSVFDSVNGILVKSTCLYFISDFLVSLVFVEYQFLQIWF